jgi:hypothetical protein
VYVPPDANVLVNDPLFIISEPGAPSSNTMLCVTQLPLYVSLQLCQAQVIVVPAGTVVDFGV